MKNKISFVRFFFAMMLFVVTMPSQAGAPLWTFTPLTATTISIPANGSATVQYQVTNQSSRTHTLAVSSIAGVTQNTSGVGICGNPFVLSGHQSCVLSLQVNGSQAHTGNTNGPVVCEQGSSLQCYRPSSPNTLNVNITQSQYSVGGAITGLADTVFLKNNGTDLTAFSSNGAFTFPTTLASGTAYNVTVETQPAGQTCSVANGVGTINGTNITNVNVTCAANAYTVGGTVSGLSGTVVLFNNGGDADTITTNGAFTFASPVAEGGTYDVTVGSQPSGQTCTVTNGAGTMGGSNVTNVSVSCTANSTTLSTNLSNLALATSGNARTITITNTGSNAAEDLSISYPTFPAGTSASSTCGSTLNASESCTITVTPGANTTSSCDSSPYTAPTPGVISVSASNVASPVTTNVVVLAYGCIYQGGYVFAIDDTTAASASMGGTTAALIDNSSGIHWNNGSNVTTNAQSLTNGLGCAQDTTGNTCLINTVQGAGSYAATTCSDYTIDSDGNSPCATGTCYNNWYLPAICEMGPDTGAGCSSGIQNMVTNLPELIAGCTGPSCLLGQFWSSTENASLPSSTAWNVTVSSGFSMQSADSKGNSYAVRCTRALTP